MEIRNTKKVDGFIYMHKGQAFLIPLMKNEEITINSFAWKLNDASYVEFFQKHIGYDKIMMITDYKTDSTGGFSFNEYCRIPISQFGKIENYGEFFEHMNKTITMLNSPDTKLYGFTNEEFNRKV
jgi:hypothetical protein